MTMTERAKKELELAGYFTPQECGLPVASLGNLILAMMKLCADEGLSGAVAPMVAELFSKLMDGALLTPLQGTDDEWLDVPEVAKQPGLQQNARFFSVFRNTLTGEAWDTEQTLFRDAIGATYISRESRGPVTFPYWPARKIVDEHRKDEGVGVQGFAEAPK